VRAKHFLDLYEAQQQLFEVEMSPSNLKKLASNVDAKVGIEYEMFVPDVEGNDEDADREEDWDADERANDIDDICNFFHDGDYNGRSEINDLREELEERFREWADEQKIEIWASDGKQELYYWIKNNVSDEDIAEYLEREVNDEEEYEPTPEDYKEAAKKSWDEEDSYYDDAREEFMDGYDYVNLSQQDFLRSIGIRNMSDVIRNLRRADITWPHWTYPTQGNVSIDEVGEEISSALGKKVYVGTSYHSAPRRPDGYSLERDSSVGDKNPIDGYDGLELISPTPPPGITETFDDMDKIIEWAKDYGCKTNSDCGLHVNISVPNYSRDKLDWVKLVLLSGDEHVLEIFGRTGWYYAESSLEIIKDRATDQKKVEQLLTKLRSGMEEIASKVLHSGNTDKYTSVNTKSGWVEIRAPGNNWLDDNIDKLKNTVLRYVVALDAACDPQKYRKEYLKALYKALPSTQKSEQTSLFAKYMAGDITKQRYADELMFKKADRLSKNGVIRLNDDQVDDGDWEVIYDDGEKHHTVYIKNTPQVDNGAEALKAAQGYEPKIFNKNTVQYVTVKRHHIDVDSELKEYKIEYNSKVMLVLAKSEEEAENIVKTIESPFAKIPSSAVDIRVSELDRLLSLRDARNLLNLQNEKLAFAEKWLSREKIFIVREFASVIWRERFNGYIAAKSVDEATAIAKQIEPSISENNIACHVYEDSPSDNSVEAYKRAQEDMIRQRKEREEIDANPIDPSDIKMYRVHNMNGYDYVVAKSEEEASDIATKLDYEKFPAGSVTAVRQEFDPRYAEGYVIRQNQRLAEAPKPYHLIDTRTNQPVPGSVFPARSEHDAIVRLRDYVNLGSHGLTPSQARDVFAVRPVSS